MLSGADDARGCKCDRKKCGAASCRVATARGRSHLCRSVRTADLWGSRGCGSVVHATASGIRAASAFIAARSRFAEECLAGAVTGGVRQVVVLGAGLDTFGLRNPHAAQGLSVFEVDHPATQRWKLDCLRKTDLERPAWLRFVAVDFETQPRLVPAGHGLIAAWPGAKGGCNDRRSRERKGKAC